jgi:hypothetical protein
MERAWLFDTVAVTVAEVDFLDPDLRAEPGARERGVRVEIRPISSPDTGGSVYRSAAVSLQPAIVRIDLLESRPGAADRMHWHPAMQGGEPGDRTFDPTLSADPIGWLRDRLEDLEELLGGAHAEAASHRMGPASLPGAADEIVAAVRTGLDSSRLPWPCVEHDERGMAITAASADGS